MIFDRVSTVLGHVVTPIMPVLHAIRLFDYFQKGSLVVLTLTRMLSVLFSVLLQNFFVLFLTASYFAIFSNRSGLGFYCTALTARLLVFASAQRGRGSILLQCELVHLAHLQLHRLFSISEGVHQLCRRCQRRCRKDVPSTRPGILLPS